jgi:hypothetical protein
MPKTRFVAPTQRVANCKEYPVAYIWLGSLNLDAFGNNCSWQAVGGDLSFCSALS